MARRNHSFKEYEVRPLHRGEEQERVFLQRVSQIVEALAVTVGEIGGVPSLPPALAKLVTCAAEASVALRTCEDAYLRTKR